MTSFVDLFSDFREVLKGKKAYIVGLLMVALGLLTNENQMVLEGLAVLALRAGIAKSN